MKNTLDQNYLPAQKDPFITEIQARELIAAALANYTGVVRFRTVESTVTTITDFTNSQHNHQNASGGGQLTSNAISGVIDVPHGGTGVNTLTGIAFGNGGGIMTAANITGIVKANGTSIPTAVTPLSGTKTYWVSDTSGGTVNRKLTFQDGVLTAET